MLPTEIGKLLAIRQLRDRIRFGLLLAALSVVANERGAAALENAADIDFFETRIRPVLVESCYGCHSADAGEVQGELTLDNRASVRRGGRSGAVIVPADPDASLLLTALEYEDHGIQMPPSGKLPDEVIEDFRRWIELGAPDPRDGSAAAIDTIATRAAEHWAFRQPERPELAAVDADGWSANSLDVVVYSELAKGGLVPSAPAKPRDLVRRLHFDLLGLPPTSDDVAAFESNPTDAAYGKLVDRLINSAQFGERWARHWLDLARFADTKGYVFTEKRDFPNAFKYRDWVIHAFNDDMPIDQFMQYQLAADLMVQGDEQQRHLAAQGFVTLGRRFINNPHDIVADRIDVIFRTMMGLTVACARCHDHKFDPISDEDYYALYGIFASSSELQDENFPLRLVEKEKPEDIGVFVRGNDHNRTEPVPRRFPTFFGDLSQAMTSGSGRLQLAQAITHPDNPLTARVFVNRVWGHLFGEQLVRSPSDFGLRCDEPRHQELLDLLATEFMSNGWSLKWLVREIVMSSTYRQSSAGTPNSMQTDPENRLWGRMNRRRLDFEALRDGLLSVSGRLEQQIGGDSERIDTQDGGTRRTLYAHIDRQNLPGVFRAFDFASPDAHSPERPHTMVPQQALFLLNNSMVQQAASQLADSLPADEPSKRVVELYRRVLARQPSPAEIQAALEFVRNRKSETLPEDEWSFGFGLIQDRGEKSRVEVQPLSFYGSNRWQQRDEFPDEQYGHLCVTAKGGHPGDRPEHSSIRRWTSPSDGKLIITGRLQRPSEKGDGIEGTVVSSQSGVLGSWVIEHGSEKTPVQPIEVLRGETIDFVVACRDNSGWDTFDWTVALTLETSDGLQRWSSEKDFHGPQPLPLDLWAQLAQVLLVSSEFLYID